TNNPTIDLFIAADADGGIRYLTNVYTAVSQTDPLGYPTTRLGPGQSLTVLSNGWGAKPLIWCGVKKGSGALTLTVMQGSNTLAKTFAYIQIKDIKEIYERYTVGDNPNADPTNYARLAQ